MATTQDSPRKFRVLDTSPIRHDGLDKVTGRAQFGADFHMPGTIYGKILRSPHAHARILSIDTSKAEALPGVKAVVTASDFPIISQALDLSQARSTPRAVAENDLAYKKALYSGHAVAAVAATSVYIAEEALDLIEVDYEVLTPVLDVQEAMKDGAPILHENLTTMFRTGNFARGDDTGIKQYRWTRSGRPGRRGGGFQAGGHYCRARAYDLDGASGIHRAIRRHRVLVSG